MGGNGSIFSPALALIWLTSFCKSSISLEQPASASNMVTPIAASPLKERLVVLKKNIWSVYFISWLCPYLLLILHSLVLQYPSIGTFSPLNQVAADLISRLLHQ